MPSPWDAVVYIAYSDLRKSPVNEHWKTSQHAVKRPHPQSCLQACLSLLFSPAPISQISQWSILAQQLICSTTINEIKVTSDQPGKSECKL